MFQTVKTMPWRASGLSLLMTVLLAISATSLAASDSVWVRIDQTTQAPALTELSRELGLADYGSLLWGQVSRETAEQLQADGMRIRIEENPFLVELGGESFDPLEIGERLATSSSNPDGDWHLIQFHGPVRPEWLSALRQQGLHLAQPLHPFGFIVWADAQQISTTRTHHAVRAQLPMQPEWKVQPHLRDFGRSLRNTMALASAHVDPGHLRSQLSPYGNVLAISPLNAHFSIVHMEVPGDRYLDIARIPALYTVQYIRQEAANRGEMSNQSIVGNIDANGLVFPGYIDWLTETGYDGSGITVGIVDDGVRATHVDLVDRMVACIASGDSPTSCTAGVNSHGTHVAGAVAGTAATGTRLNGFLRGQGVAPGANLISQDYRPFLSGSGPGSMVPDGMLKIFRESALSGALLTNNSWGPTGSPQGYDIPTQQIDFISRDALPGVPGHQPVLAVWSVMNGNGDSSGACAPASLGSPDEAKNLFAVGSTSLLTGSTGTQVSNIFSVSSNSAHGPACDGRRVPHIVAPGCRTDSTTSSSDTAHSATQCGTSMASPVVSGAVAIWAEKYIEQTGNNPSPALVKAVFTAAAQDLVGNPNADGGIMGHRPDRFQGFGRLDLDLVMNHGVEVFLHDQEEIFTETGQSWSIGLNAVDPDQPIRIMLAWTDAPGHGLGGPTPAWVNDLDLVVEAQGNTYLGNVTGPDGWSATGGAADFRNNLEGVFLSPAQHGGTINITVNASNISGDALNPWNPSAPSQDFALACYNCLVGNPTFNLAISPSAAEFCVPDSGSESLPVNITLGTVGQYDGTVGLSDSDIPPGISSTINPTQVQAPGSANWALEISSDAQPGSFLLGLSGDDGDNQVERTLALQLEAFLETTPSLQAPGDNASDLTLTPTFTWSGIGSVDNYQIQIATDSDFINLVADESIESDSFTLLNELGTGTVYFWRVRGINLCGGGEWSPTFVFTTRLEPVAEFSSDSLSFELLGNTTSAGDLIINNSGTDNLTWSIETDQLATESVIGRFDGAFAPDNWTLVNSPSNTAGSVAIGSDVPVEILITGGNSNVGGFTELQIEVPFDGVINFDWGYQSTDTGDFDRGGYSLNGNLTVLANNASQVPFFNQSVSVEVSAGDIFGLRVVTQDGRFGAGVLGVSSFEFVPSFCEGDLSTVSWLTATPATGTVAAGDTETVAIGVNTIGLDNGDYLGYLCVSTNDPNAALVAIPVELTVSGQAPAQPQIAVTPESLVVNLSANQSTTETVSIANAGSAMLDWAIETTATAGRPYPSPAVHQLTATLPQSGPRSGSRNLDGEPSLARVEGTRFSRAITGNWTEGFDDIASLTAQGWSLINNSSPLGVSGWFQGNDSEGFAAHAGAPDAYVAAAFTNASGDGTISNWMITPEIALNEGTEIRFWTRTVDATVAADRLQVRLSTSGASDNVGTTAQSMGDFESLLLDINPTYTLNGYPNQWTEYVITLSDIPEGATGRLAFRYFVESGGPEGSNSNYIGIDSLSITQPNGNGSPEPGSCDSPATVNWLSVSPAEGSLAPLSAPATSELLIDTQGLQRGLYQAVLCISSNDPDNPVVEVPVTLDVNPMDRLFDDRFEDD